MGCIKEKNCDFLATVTFVNSSKHVIIDLYKESLKDNEYVAVGFSGDKLMGDDLVFMSSPSEDVLMKAWNVRYSHPEDVGGITELDYSKSHENGMFHCKFELEKMLTFTNVASGEQKTVDFSQLHHILLAWGPMQSKMKIGRHGSSRRAVSKDSVIVTAFVKNEQFESTTEGSIWNLSFFFLFPLLTQQNFVVHAFYHFVFLGPEPKASGATPHGYYTVYEEGLSPEECQAIVGARVDDSCCTNNPGDIFLEKLFADATCTTPFELGDLTVAAHLECHVGNTFTYAEGCYNEAAGVADCDNCRLPVVDNSDYGCYRANDIPGLDKNWFIYVESCGNTNCFFRTEFFLSYVKCHK